MKLTPRRIKRISIGLVIACLVLIFFMKDKTIPNVVTIVGTGITFAALLYTLYQVQKLLNDPELKSRASAEAVEKMRQQLLHEEIFTSIGYLEDIQRNLESLEITSMRIGDLKKCLIKCCAFQKLSHADHEEIRIFLYKLTASKTNIDNKIKLYSYPFDKSSLLLRLGKLHELLIKIQSQMNFEIN